jgi:CheY-like chemotaxis protein
MAKKTKANIQTGAFDFHKYYLDIINCMPNIVYWVDIDCNLKGCSHNFVKLLGLKQIKDFKGTPYEQMTKFTTWTKERIEAFKLDDMKVLFSGEPQYNIEESPVLGKKGEEHHYLATRVPLLDKDKHITGLVVVLTDVSHQKIHEKTPYTVSEPIPMYTHEQPHEHPSVLMVEDNFIAQKVEEALLTSLNCQVDVADSGDKAVLLFDPGKYDIVFMDIGLQDTSGYMVAKKMRQMEKDTTYHVPIIALTSYQADVVQYDCNDYFMDGVLTKPLTSEQAKQIIQHYIYHENVPVNGLKSAK